GAPTLLLTGWRSPLRGGDDLREPVEDLLRSLTLGLDDDLLALAHVERQDLQDALAADRVAAGRPRHRDVHRGLHRRLHERGRGPGVQPHLRRHPGLPLPHPLLLSLRSGPAGPHVHWNNLSPARTAPSARAVTVPSSASSATTGQTGERPPASISAGSQATTGWPARTRSPSAASSRNPFPLSWTVSMPRCTSTPLPSSPTMTYACGCSFMIFPLMGATAAPGPLQGSIAAPGPTIPAENTGSGTADSPTAAPSTGARTVVMASPSSR